MLFVKNLGLCAYGWMLEARFRLRCECDLLRGVTKELIVHHVWPYVHGSHASWRAYGYLADRYAYS